MTTINQQLEELLESIVDRTSMALVLFALEQVCYEKSEHVRSNWQDESLAEAWQDAGESIGKAAVSTGVNGVSIAPPSTVSPALVDWILGRPTT